METFFTVLLVIVGIVLVIGLVGWAGFVWIECENWNPLTKMLNSVGAVLALAALIAVAINSGLITNDNAAHCGPGTRYVSESHYNPATKTTITDWMCTV